MVVVKHTLTYIWLRTPVHLALCECAYSTVIWHMGLYTKLFSRAEKCA